MIENNGFCCISQMFWSRPTSSRITTASQSARPNGHILAVNPSKEPGRNQTHDWPHKERLANRSTYYTLQGSQRIK